MVKSNEFTSKVSHLSQSCFSRDEVIKAVIIGALYQYVVKCRTRHNRKIKRAKSPSKLSERQ